MFHSLHWVPTDSLFESGDGDIVSDVLPIDVGADDLGSNGGERLHPIVSEHETCSEIP